MPTTPEDKVQTPIVLREVWVNYAYLGMDEGWPESEMVGTLIQTMSHGFIVKTSDIHGRRATPEEIKEWTGPVSPEWFASTFNK